MATPGMFDTPAEETMEHTPEPADTAAPAPELPDWLPEKFAVFEDGKVNLEASAQKMAGSYSELEKQFSTRTEAKPDAEEPAQPEQPAGESAVDVAARYYEENGELSDEMYERLSTVGLTRDIVDSYIQAQSAQADTLVNEVMAAAGGSEEYAKVSQWAANTLSEAELDAYNKVVDSGNMAAAKFAVEGLTARYRNAVGWRPNLVAGEGTRGITMQPYESQAEMLRDMQDARYATDPAFRNKVAERLRHSAF